MDEEITCAICQKSLDNGIDAVTHREKESEGINWARRERNNRIQTVSGQKVHQTCRREYCHTSYINRAKKKERESSKSSRRSLDRKTEQSFNFKTDCFFCGTNVDLEDQKRRKGDVFRATTLETKHTVLQTCFERNDLLFLHAILGCDTTSSVHGIGKAGSLKEIKYANSLHFRKQAKVFNSPSTYSRWYCGSRRKTLVLLYGRKPGQKLDCMRYQRYCVRNWRPIVLKCSLRIFLRRQQQPSIIA